MKYYPSQKQYDPNTQGFIFATGIEWSYPTIETYQGTKRRDQMEECGHYKNWREDLQLTVDLGVRFLRYGPPYYRVHAAASSEMLFTQRVATQYGYSLPWTLLAAIILKWFIIVSNRCLLSDPALSNIVAVMLYLVLVLERD